MPPEGVPEIPTGEPAVYEIRVRGVLEQGWHTLMDDMTLRVVEVDGQRVTVLRVVVPDKASLAGLLDALFGLNATVLSVEAVDPH